MRLRGIWLAVGGCWTALVWVNAGSAHALNLDWVWRYFWPPVGPWTCSGVAAAQARNAAAILGLAVFDLAAWGAGACVVGWVGGRGLPGVFGLGLAVAAGMAVLGTAAVACGLIGLAFPGVFVFVVIAGVAALVAVRPVPRPGLSAVGAALRGVPVPLALLGGVLAFGALLGALAPEVSADALRHWLEVPRRALLLHRIVPPERWPLGWLPLQPAGENLCLAVLAGELPVRLLSWQASVFVAAMVLVWGGAWGAVGAVAWLAGLNNFLLAQLAWPDTRAAAWVMLAVYAGFNGRRWRLAGLCWGAAVATKPQVAVFLAAAAAGVALAAGARSAVGRGARLLAWAAVPLLPWLLRNWLGAGNAVAPFGAGVLPGFFVQQREWLRHDSLAAVLAAPFTAAARVSIWDALLSPALVAALPLAFLPPSVTGARGVSRSGETPGAVSTRVLMVAGWAWTAGYAGRYLVPAVPVLLVGCALGAARLELSRRVRTTVVAGFALALAWEGMVSISLAFYVFNPAGVALGREAPATYLRRVLAPRPVTWDVAKALRRHVRAAAPCYVSGVADAHYWPGLPVLEGEGMPPPLAVWAGASADWMRLRVALRQRNLRWIVDEGAGRGLIPGLRPAHTAWSPRALAVWRECFRRHARPVLVAGGYTLWALDANPHALLRLPPRLPATGYP